MPTEIQIFKDAQSGNRKAQLEVYDTFYKTIYNSCYRILLNKEDTEDTCHDTFIHVFDKKILPSKTVKLKAWLSRIAINKSIDLLRRQKKIKFTDDIIHKEIPKIEENEYLNINPKIIYNSIKKLPQQYQLIINLYLIEGYDHEEISKILGISKSTSRSQLSRAKQKLKTVLTSI